MRYAALLAGLWVALLGCGKGADDAPKADDGGGARKVAAGRGGKGGRREPAPKTRVILAIAISPDGKYIATGESLGKVTLWDATKDQLPYQPGLLSQPEKGVWTVPAGVGALGFSHDSKFVYALDNRSEIQVLDRATGKKGRSFALAPEGHSFYWVGFLPGGKELVTVHQGKLKFWDLAKGEVVRTVPTTAYPGESLVDVRPDGKRFLTRKEGSTTIPSTEPGGRPVSRNYHEITEWDLTTGKATRTLGKGRIEYYLQGGYLPDGRSAWFQDEKGIAFWDLERGERKPLVLEKFTGKVAFSPDGKRMATFDSEGRVELRDPDTGRVLRRLPQVKVLGYIRFTPDGKGLLVYGWHLQRGGKEERDDIGDDNRRLLIWDFGKGQWRLLAY